MRDALAVTLKAHGISCRTEVAINGRERPADLALDHFDPKGPLAIDLHVNHPLAPGLPHEFDSVASTLAQKDSAKLTKYGSLCESAGWLFQPLGFHPWGGLAPLGSALLHRMVKQAVGDSQGWERMQKIQSFRHDVSFSLMKFVAQQLLPIVAVTSSDTLPLLPEMTTAVAAASAAASPMHVDGPPAEARGANMFGQAPVAQTRIPDLARLPVSRLDMDDWQCEVRGAEEVSEFRVGPIRVRCRLDAKSSAF